MKRPDAKGNTTRNGTTGLLSVSHLVAQGTLGAGHYSLTMELRK